MTTIKSILNWLFGIYQDSELFQKLLAAAFTIPIIVAMAVYLYMIVRGMA